MPLWCQFPGAEEVRLLSPMAADANAPSLHLVLATRYPDLAAMDAALAGPVREASREPTGRLLDLFDGDVFHLTLFGEDLLAHGSHCGVKPDDMRLDRSRDSI